MAELGEAQRVVYGDLAAVYNDLPFTLSHWRVTHARRVAPDNTSAGQDRRYELTGWIAADDESALATAKAAAEAVLGADGGDFRVQIPKWNPGPFPSVTWHTIEALLSADCQDGIRVAELSVAPAGGPRLDVALTLAAFVPDADDAGIVWATWTDAAEDDDEGRPGRSSAGQVKARRGVSPSLYVQSVVLPILRGACAFEHYQEAVRLDESEDGTLCEFEVRFRQLTGGYPAGVDDGERTVTRLRDEHHGVITRDEGTYRGSGALAWVQDLIGAAGGALRAEYSYVRHKESAVAWSIESIGSADGPGKGCVLWRERIAARRSLGGSTFAKEYGSTGPLLVARSADDVQGWVQEGHAVSDAPDIYLAPPEKIITGAVAAPAEIAIERLNARQNVTTWRYETVTTTAPPFMIRPQTRDEGAAALVPEAAGSLKLKWG